MSQKPKVGMDAFFTRAAANEGIEVPLFLPTGEKSEHTLRIRGVDSDAFRQADAESRRKLMDIVQIEDLIQRQAELDRAQAALIASLVIDWSFDEPCTPEAVIEFFIQAPHIKDAVDQLAAKRKLFFGQRSSNSSTTQKPSSGSTKSPRARNKPSGQASSKLQKPPAKGPRN